MIRPEVIRPSRRLVLLLALGIAVALLPAVVDQRLWPLWAVYAGGCLLAFVADALLGLPRSRLAMEPHYPAVQYIGRESQLGVELSTPTWGGQTAVEVLADLDPDLLEQESQVVWIPPRGSAWARIPLVARRRGRPRVQTVWLRWTGPFGLAQRVVRRPLDHPIPVVPDIHAVRAAALRFFGSREYLHGLKVERHDGDGTEFDSLREYVPGHDARSIDWKASARHTRLVCRKHRAERNHQVYLAFDTGHLMREPLGDIPKLDHAINAALVLGYVCLRTGDRVGVHAFDERVRVHDAPRSGVASLHPIQLHTAALEYSDAETNFTVGLTDLLTRVNRRSLVILFTDFVDTVTAELMVENVRRLARKHVVLFVALRDPELDALARARPDSLLDLHRAVTAGDLVRERDTVVRRLRRIGVSCIDAAPHELSADLINRYLDLKRRERV